MEVTDELAEAYIPTTRAGGFGRPFSWRRTTPGLVRGESWTICEADGTEIVFCAAAEDARFIVAALDFALDALAAL